MKKADKTPKSSTPKTVAELFRSLGKPTKKGNKAGGVVTSLPKPPGATKSSSSEKETTPES